MLEHPEPVYPPDGADPWARRRRRLHRHDVSARRCVRRQRRRFILEPASLITAAPRIGSPDLREIHHLEAMPLVTETPIVGCSWSPPSLTTQRQRKRDGRPPSLTPEQIEEGIRILRGQSKMTVMAAGATLREAGIKSSPPSLYRLVIKPAYRISSFSFPHFETNRFVSKQKVAFRNNFPLFLNPKIAL